MTEPGILPRGNLPNPNVSNYDEKENKEKENILISLPDNLSEQ